MRDSHFHWPSLSAPACVAVVDSARFCLVLRIVIGSVWIFHGLYSKLLNEIPRHRAIVGRVLGDDVAGWITPAIDILEMGLGLWVLSTRWPRRCALAQTLALVAMNTLEILFARGLLVSPVGMVALNLVLIASAWFVAGRPVRMSGGARG